MTGETLKQIGWLAGLCACVLGALALTACADEGPTEVGGVLIPDDLVRTYDIVLDASRFLEFDTAIGGFTRPWDTGFRIMASAYEGSLDARLLARFATPPKAVAYRDTNGNTRTDTMPTYMGGELVMWIDTLRTERSEPVLLRLYRIGEEWDPPSATWTHRVDTAGVREPWSEPGVALDAFVAEATWTADTDSVVFRVDSLTAALWADTLSDARGALIVAATPGTRLRSNAMVFRFEARPSERPDTTVFVTVSMEGSTFILNPPPEVTGDIHVGGTPAWRTYLGFRPLASEVVPCPDGPAGCTIALRDIQVNYAALELDPLPVGGGYAPEDSVLVEARYVLAVGAVPLARAPLGDRAGPLLRAVSGGRFAPEAPAGDKIEIPITSFVRQLVTTPREGDPDPATVLALLSLPENGTLGFARFAGPGGTGGGPRLRLVVTVADEVNLR